MDGLDGLDGPEEFDEIDEGIYSKIVIKQKKKKRSNEIGKKYHQKVEHVERRRKNLVIPAINEYLMNEKANDEDPVVLSEADSTIKDFQSVENLARTCQSIADRFEQLGLHEHFNDINDAFSFRLYVYSMAHGQQELFTPTNKRKEFEEALWMAIFRHNGGNKLRQRFGDFAGESVGKENDHTIGGIKRRRWRLEVAGWLKRELEQWH